MLPLKGRIRLDSDPLFQLQTDEALYGRFFHEMLSRGVALAPGAYEVLFPGWAHTDDVLDEIIERAADAAGALGVGR